MVRFMRMFNRVMVALWVMFLFGDVARLLEALSARSSGSTVLQRAGFVLWAAFWLVYTWRQLQYWEDKDDDDPGGHSKRFRRRLARQGA